MEMQVCGKCTGSSLLIGMTSFWNGAAVIGGLLILMGFAVCSDGKLDYLITAVTAVGFSVLQTRLFMNGSSVEAAFQWGFISEDKKRRGCLVVSDPDERSSFRER